MISEQPMSYADVVGALRAAGCVFAEDEARLLIDTALGADVRADVAADRLRQLVSRRVAGAPLEPLIGWAEFCGLRVAVEPRVFVPRRRTEFLVAQAGELARVLASEHPLALEPDRADTTRPLVVDLCCGTGAIGLAVVTTLGSASLHACDIDPVAVRCVAQNIAPVGGIAYQGDLFDPLPAELRGQVDLIVCNAPYVPTDAIALMPPEARDHEPRVALDGGADGVTIHRRVAGLAVQWLRPGGSLLIETSRSQATETQLAMQLGGLRCRIARSDEYDATVAIGTRDRQDVPHAAVGK